jgi:N-acetylglucosaminyl-diphospho-decaprenol L-rhamnosyltransferase
LVEVAVINWNTAAAALAAARAFLRSEEVEVAVTIVDNASRREERRQLEAAAGEEGLLRVLMPERNLGYGAAANLALRDGRAPLVCVSNADVAPEPRALAALAAVAEGVEDAGMVGPVFAGGTQHYHSRLPGRAALLARPFLGSAGKAPPRAPRPGEVLPVEQASGACFAMRREVWDAFGGFDEGYFLWYDDVDLARRLHDRGRRNLVVGSSVVRHLGAASFAQIDPRTAQAIRLASLRRYIGKHHPELSRTARPLLAAARALRARGAAPPPDG